MEYVKMKFMNNIYRNRLIRPIVLFVIKKLNRDIIIKHHYTDERFSLNLYKHKGYWYHGKNRERETMNIFKEIIDPTDTILDIGGHIGYLTLYFNSLISSRGRIFVFEPGLDNLYYLKKNLIQHNIQLIEKAISDKNGTINFFVESMTGQNNSIYENYPVFKVNKEYSSSKEQYNKVKVQSITVDSAIDEYGISPDFIKIDIEGAELLALKGMLKCLAKFTPKMLIEVTLNKNDVFALLIKEGYIMISPQGKVIKSPNGIGGNIFCLHEQKHKDYIKKITK